MSLDSRPNLTIEIATPAHREAVVELLAAQLVEHDIELHPEHLQYAVNGFFEDSRRGRILVALRENQVVGVAVLSITWTLEHGGKSCWLDELYVRPEFRAFGVGTTLLRKAFEVMAADGCICMDLEVESSHARAANLYVREGFRVHTRTRYVRVLRQG